MKGYSEMEENFMPSVQSIQLFVNDRPLEGIVKIGKVDTHISAKVVLSGLSQLVNPITGRNVPITIYCSHFTQRGMRDYVVHNVQKVNLRPEDYEKGTVEITHDLGEFYKPFIFNDGSEEFNYDFLSNILFFKVQSIIGEQNTDISNEYIVGDVRDCLLNIKVPMVMENE